MPDDVLALYFIGNTTGDDDAQPGAVLRFRVLDAEYKPGEDITIVHVREMAPAEVTP